MLDDLLFRLRAIFRRRSVEAELDDELRFHLEQEVEKLMRSGLSREEASRRARRALGGLDQVKEECRDARGVSILETAMQDIRHGMRGLRRNPGLAILATLTLSLGMAASTLMFSIFQATLLRPMPFRDADRVAQLWETRLDRGMNRISFTEANFWDLRAQNHSFEEVAAIHYFEANMTGAGPAEKVSGSAVTAGFFRTLGTVGLRVDGRNASGRTPSFAVRRTVALPPLYRPGGLGVTPGDVDGLYAEGLFQPW